MKTYQSFGALARALERVSLKLEGQLAVAMEESAVLVEKVAKEEIGHYQREDMGPFTPWAELTEETKQSHRMAIVDGIAAPDAGENTPLLVSGKLRSEIKHESSFRSFVVGSEDEILLYQELGTSRGIPPRPVLAPALYRNTEPILNIIGKTIRDTLAGKK